MCILCDNDVLRRLTSPLESFAPGELAEAVRDARDAAGPGVLDYADAVLRGEEDSDVGPSLYGEIVIARAVESGVVEGGAAFDWERRLRGRAGARDPRVQAFVSSCAEILDDYRLILAERRSVLERFVEAPNEEIAFSGLGQDGEVWFDYRGESYAVLTQDEAMEVVERELAGALNAIPPEVLLRYSTLPDAGLEVINGVLAKPPEVANDILAGMIDLPLLADDRARTEGFAPYFGEPSSPAEDLRFGEWVIVRAAASH